MDKGRRGLPGDKGSTGATGPAGTASTLTADPGNAGAIPVAAAGAWFDVALTVGGAPETRTLAAPSARGQRFTANIDATTGGTVAIASTASVNPAGNKTITLTGAGSSVILQAIKVGAGVQWAVVSLGGAVVSA